MYVNDMIRIDLYRPSQMSAKTAPNIVNKSEKPSYTWNNEVDKFVLKPISLWKNNGRIAIKNIFNFFNYATVIFIT